MADLDTLRPEVREAINRTDIAIEMFDTLVTVNRDDYDIIRAELLRLTDDCARLVDCVNAQPPTRRSLIDRAERAEAELAKLRDAGHAKTVPSLLCGRTPDGRHYVVTGEAESVNIVSDMLADAERLAEALHNLVSEWVAIADDGDATLEDSAIGYRACANRLSAMLAAEGNPND